MRKLLLAVLAISCLIPGRQAGAGESAVVVMYHRFGEPVHPSTNITIEQFEAHLAEIRDGQYNVMPLPDIVAALQAGRSLPDKTVGISVDDAFLSVYREAWPRLRAAGLPFTLFVATDAIDARLPDYASWDQLREMRDAGVTFGSQTASHPHMPLLSTERNAAELAKSNARFKAELGFVPKLIAYPYGEYSLAVREVAKQAGFTAGFGQHSGVMHTKSDFYYLPRFAFNESYGDVARFRRAGRALPLAAIDITPADPFLGNGAQNPPAVGFTVVGDALKGVSRLACYASREGQLHIERLGEQRIEVRPREPFPTGRSRVNCTMPAGDGRWRWFGRQYMVPR